MLPFLIAARVHGSLLPSSLPLRPHSPSCRAALQPPYPHLVSLQGTAPSVVQDWALLPDKAHTVPVSPLLQPAKSLWTAAQACLLSLPPLLPVWCNLQTWSKLALSDRDVKHDKFQDKTLQYSTCYRPPGLHSASRQLFTYLVPYWSRSKHPCLSTKILRRVTATFLKSSKSSHFNLEGHQVGLAWFILGKVIATVPLHLLLQKSVSIGLALWFSVWPICSSLDWPFFKIDSIFAFLQSFQR